MSTPLIFLAALVAANPLRVAAVAPTDPSRRRRASVLAVALVAVAVGVLVSVSTPLLDLLDVSGSSSRIAAGVAVVMISTRDLFTTLPGAEPALPGPWAGLVPMAFPTMLSPSAAMVAVAAGSERGIVSGAAPILLAIVLAGVAGERGLGGRYRPVFAAAVGGAGVAVGALLTLDGVYAI